MKKAIRFHSCATFEYQSDTYIITVGGLSTKTTQILNTKHTEWFYGKLDSQWYKLWIPSNCFFTGPEFDVENLFPMTLSLPTPLQDEVMWVLGGKYGTKNSDSIYKLICQSKPETSPGCQWRKVEQKLKDPRMSAVVITLL